MGRGMWGIDISRYSIKSVRLEQGPGGITLTGLDVTNIPGSAESEGAEPHILEGLLDLKKRMKIGGESVCCSMPGHATFNRIIKLPPVEAEKMAEIVKYEAQSQIPFPLDEVVWDYQRVERQYLAGEEQEVMLFAVKREIVESFLTNIEKAVLSVDAVQFSPVAMYNFLCYDTDLNEGTIVLDLGADNTDLLLTDGQRFWIRNIPVTGNQITKALAEKLNKPFAEAERIKRKAAQTKNAQALYATMQPVYGELVSEIHRSLGYFKSVSRSARFEKAILMGNATKALNFQRYFSQNLRVPANRIQKLNKIAVGPRVDQAALAANLGSLGTAIGLALQGFGLTKNAVNLLPVRFVRAKHIKKKEPMAIASAALLLVTSILAYLSNSGRLDELKLQRDRITKAKESYEASLAEVNSVRDQSGPSAALNDVRSFNSPRDYIPRIISALNPNIPDNGSNDLPPQEKIWLLHWKFNETADQLVPAPTPPVPAGGRPTKEFYLPSQRRLKLELEAAVVGGVYNATTGGDFIKSTLLNWNSSKKEKVRAAGVSPLVIKGLTVAEGDLKVDPLPEQKHLYPSHLKPPTDFEESETPYLLFRVTITYTPAAPAPPAEAPATGG